MDITRLAPSPTGALHLGNARTFLINWLLARRNGWRILLRIEDIDGPRIRKGADRQAIDDLQWLGIDWDDGPIYQSTRLRAYQTALQSLLADGHAYPCVCSRSEVHSAASAPHAEDGAAVYPGTCRGRFNNVSEAIRISGREPAIRFRVPDETVSFTDRFSGNQSYDVARELGDFVIAKADGTPAYQLAVVIDDAEMGVTHVVRGDDLVDSTPRQLLLYRALGLSEKQPHYYHLPLVTGPDGRRLAKRHGDTRLSFYRERKVSAARVLQLLARWCSLNVTKEPTIAADLLPTFDLSLLPRQPIVFTPDDDAWLRGVSNARRR
jgi:glutamyl-tRNA synthetase